MWPRPLGDGGRGAIGAVLSWGRERPDCSTLANLTNMTSVQVYVHNPVNLDAKRLRHCGAKTAARVDRCPLYPRKQTCAVQKGMSAMGQKRTCAMNSVTLSFGLGRVAQPAAQAARGFGAPCACPARRSRDPRQ